MTARVPHARRVAVGATALALVAALAACSTAGSTSAAETTSAAAETLTIYSGRNENLVGPILEGLEAAV